MTVITAKDLEALGYRLHEGKAVKIAEKADGIRPTTLAVFRTSPYRSKWELERAEILELGKRAGKIRDWRYEAVRLKLADGAWYKSDFLIWHNEGTLELQEVKGHWREAARVRWKVAVSQYPMFAFSVVGKKGGKWVDLELSHPGAA